MNQFVKYISQVPGWARIIENIWGQEAEQKAIAHVDEMEAFYKSEEADYYKNEYPKVKKLLDEFKEENKEFANECEDRRNKEMEEALVKKTEELLELTKHHGKIKEKEKLLKEAKELDKRLNSEITEAMIEQARNHPITELIQHTNLWAVCPFHNDTSPSLYLKNNYAHCFACGESADSIKLHRELSGCSFQEAVKNLC